MTAHNKRLSTIDTIYNKIKKNIIELVYDPNQQLVEVDLASEFEISRTPLRHALYRLELEGLIIKQPNGRIAVAPMSIQESREIFLIREVMEGLIAREATRRIATNDDFDLIIHRLEDSLFLMRNAAETDRQQDVVSYGSDFHEILELYSENDTAAIMLEQINNRIARYRRLGAYKDPKYPSIIPVQEHEEIFACVKEKDEMAAEKAMRAHIRRSLETTVSTLSYLSF